MPFSLSCRRIVGLWVVSADFLWRSVVVEKCRAVLIAAAAGTGDKGDAEGNSLRRDAERGRREESILFVVVLYC